MDETSLSLLDRLQAMPDGPAWRRLVDLYTPLIHNWLRRQGVAGADADDLTQEVLATVVRELPRFRHDQRCGAFRCWLRTITANRLRGHWRAQRFQPRAPAAFEQALSQLEDPHSDLGRLWDLEHDRHVLRRLLALVEPELSSVAWQAFRRTALEGATAVEVAEATGMTVNAVLLAKSRVLGRLRREARGLLELAD